MKKILIFLAVLCASYATTTAQVLFDVISFEAPVTNPATKVISNTQNHSLSGYDWTLPGVYYGPGDNNDYKLGSQSARFRRLNDATGPNGQMIMQEDYPAGFEYFGFMARMYGTDIGGQLEVAYSENGGTSWIVVDTFYITNNANRYEIHEHINRNVRFRISKVDATDARINVDSIYCIPMIPPPVDLSISHFSPRGRTHPSVDRLVVVFDQHITEGDSGKLTLVDVTNNVSIDYDLSNPNVSIDDQSNALIISNISLLPETQYYVVFDSTMIKSEYHDDLSDGIYDPTEWAFTTTLPHLFQVEENFDVCDQWDLLGIFNQYSVYDGSRRWNCEQENGNTFIAMSGAGNNGHGVQNEDWLVSYLKFDFGGRAPILQFSERKTGQGDGVVRKIYHTSRFNINITTTFWTEIATISDQFVDDQWKETTINLEHDTVMNVPGNLAIMYKNETDNTGDKVWKWSLDSFKVLVDTTVSVEHIDNIMPSMYVIYPNTSNMVNYVIYSNEHIDRAQIVITDIMGRVVRSQQQTIWKGNNKYAIEQLNLAPGIYNLSVSTDKGIKTKKFNFIP